MPLRPFPLRLSVGTDVTRISRFVPRIGPDPHGVDRRFLEKMLTERERALFRYRFARDDGRSELGRLARARYLAGRWAVKEAVIKAFAPGRKLFLLDVEVHAYGSHPAPFAVVLDGCAGRSPDGPRDESLIGDGTCPRDELAREGPPGRASQSTDEEMLNEEPKFEPEGIHGQVVSVSLSHDGDVVTACALAALDGIGHGDDVGGEAMARGALGWSPWRP